MIPGVDWYGLECPSLTRLGDGQILHGQWRWRPRDVDRETDRPLGRYERPGHPRARGDDGFCVPRSLDGGKTWITGERIDTAPYSGAYTIRSAAELPDGEIVLAVADVPRWEQIYVLRSRDHGLHWRVGAPVARPSFASAPGSSCSRETCPPATFTSLSPTTGAGTGTLPKRRRCRVVRRTCST